MSGSSSARQIDLAKGRPDSFIASVRFCAVQIEKHHFGRRIMMKLAGCVLFALSVALVNNAAAAGCAKGAVVGGVAGHVAGKHGVAGAAAGCAVGHHEAGKKAKAASQAAAASAASAK
ncbi:hypothetical protein [Paraburkholderia sp. GAS32]|uniref:hypothetical protein n=1 Tax=Paraburkholderia sp. GAS32 TaxID=3035129 RepID=UPI003D25566E